MEKSVTAFSRTVNIRLVIINRDLKKWLRRRQGLTPGKKAINNLSLNFEIIKPVQPADRFKNLL